MSRISGKVLQDHLDFQLLHAICICQQSPDSVSVGLLNTCILRVCYSVPKDQPRLNSVYASEMYVTAVLGTVRGQQETGLFI